MIKLKYISAQFMIKEGDIAYIIAIEVVIKDPFKQAG